MHSIPWIALFVLLPLAGCMDDLTGGSGSSYEPRTLEFTLEVGTSSQETIPLYTLNDGERQMEVVAMGFRVPGQEELRVPNPEIRLKEGDTLILNIVNNNPLPHTFHLHGGLVPWEMDGVPYLTQPPIHTGEEYQYIFSDLKAGTYFYHCHVDVAHHMDLGMYGAFIVEEVDPEIEYDEDFVLMLDEWDNCHVHGNTEPVTGVERDGYLEGRTECLLRVANDNLAQNQLARSGTDPACNQNPPEPLYSQLGCGAHAPPAQQEERTWYPMTFPVYDPEYNTYLINGKAFPDTAPIAVAEGQTIKLRLMNVGDEMHSMHIHGHNMLVTHRDGYALEHPFRVDTLGIMPGERYDAIVEMNNPGYWAFHDHVGLNIMNDHHSPGGMFTCIAYDGFHGYGAFGMERALECIDNAIEIFGGHEDHGGAARRS